MQGRRFLVTGGAGFIGSAYIRYGLEKIPFCERLVNVDALTYAGSLSYLDSVAQDPRYLFVHADIMQEPVIEDLCIQEKIDTIVHFAAETHVDRSIAASLPFVDTNVKGTAHLLEVVRRHPQIHFHHISTDEVYGSLGETGRFTENSPYCPSSPYAASKAASDHLVRAYAHTYGLSTGISHCTNNYGPCQFPEKFIPRMIFHCLNGLPLPIYGTGVNVRDWLYVEDHVEALWLILEKRKRGAEYGIGGGCEKRNIEVLELLMQTLATLEGTDSARYRSLITFVPDRPGHDLRYAIDSSKIQRELGWYPRHSFQEGLEKTIAWYKEVFKAK